MLKSLVIVSAILLACRVEASVFDLPPDKDSIVGELKVVTTAGDNTLVDIARHFDVGYDEITLANPGVDVWLPKREDRIVVPTQFILPPKPWVGGQYSSATYVLFSAGEERRDAEGLHVPDWYRPR